MPTSGSRATSSSWSPPRATRRRTASPTWPTSCHGAPRPAPRSLSSPRPGLTPSSRAAATSSRRTSRRSRRDVLRHRVLLSYEAEAENVTSDQVVTPDPRARRGPVKRRKPGTPDAPPRDREEDPPDQDPDQPAGRRRAGGGVPLGLPRPRDGVLGGPRVRSRRRREVDRLERHGADGRAARQEVRRGARPDGPPRPRPLGVARRSARAT